MDVYDRPTTSEAIGYHVVQDFLVQLVSSLVRVAVVV